MTVARQIGRFILWSGIAQARDRQNMFWAFGFFTLLLALFLGALSGGDPAVRVTLTAALVTVAVMANALFSVGVGLAGARDRGVFRRFATLPMPRWAMVAAMVATRMLIVAASALLLVLLARVLFKVPWTGGVLGWFTLITAGTAAFSALGFLIAGAASASHVANTWTNVVFIPMMAFGGTTLPPAMLPPAIAHVSEALPSRAMVDGLVAAFVAGAGLADLLPHYAHLLAWTVLATGAGIYTWRKRLP